MDENDTFEALRRPTIDQMAKLHTVWLDERVNSFITIEKSEEFFRSHGWEREEFISQIKLKGNIRAS